MNDARFRTSTQKTRERFLDGLNAAGLVPEKLQKGDIGRFLRAWASVSFDATSPTVAAACRVADINPTTARSWIHRDLDLRRVMALLAGSALEVDVPQDVVPPRPEPTPAEVETMLAEVVTSMNRKFVPTSDRWDEALDEIRKMIRGDTDAARWPMFQTRDFPESTTELWRDLQAAFGGDGQWLDWQANLPAVIIAVRRAEPPPGLTTGGWLAWNRAHGIEPEAAEGRESPR